MSSAKRAAEAAAPLPSAGPTTETVEITPLGAGSEVGRSCIKLSFRGKTVLLDCGVHPGMQGLASLPYFDEVDMSEARLIFIKMAKCFFFSEGGHAMTKLPRLLISDLFLRL